MSIQNVAEIEFLSGFTSEQLVDLLPIITHHSYPAGEVIVKVNQPATDLYIIVSGKVEIDYLPYDGASIIVDQLTDGDMFGWSAILGREVYTATVRALTESRVLSIPSLKIHQLCRQQHDTGVVLLKKMASSISRRPNQPVDLVTQLINQALNCETDIKSRGNP